ncbi:hypothetical protein HOO68_04170 [Candidatus Gracilibacteria bacterium]|nr:hypothetical protein [Candidatus Gracilibacteria bacterium]
MKKYIYLGSLSIAIISITGASSSFASDNTTTSNIHPLPPEFSILSESDITTLESLTGSARNEYLTSRGIISPKNNTGSNNIRNNRNGSGSNNQKNPEGLTLTDTEKTALQNMTAAEREVFFTSKGITRPTESGSGKLNQKKQNNISNTTNTTAVTSNNESRKERIAKQQAKLLEQKKTKIQKKIAANESLNRLEKKFADTNGIEY